MAHPFGSGCTLYLLSRSGKRDKRMPLPSLVQKEKHQKLISFFVTLTFNLNE